MARPEPRGKRTSWWERAAGMGVVVAISGGLLVLAWLLAVGIRLVVT